MVGTEVRLPAACEVSSGHGASCSRELGQVAGGRCGRTLRFPAAGLCLRLAGVALWTVRAGAGGAAGRSAGPCHTPVKVAE